MSAHERVLPTAPMGSVLRLVEPEQRVIRNDSEPALTLLLDFSQHRPPTICSDTGLKEAHSRLTLSEEGYRLVVDKAGKFTGILTLKDIMGARPMSLASQRRVTLDDLSARDIMRPFWSMPSLRHRDLVSARVGELVTTFKKLGTEYLVVTDDDPEQPGERLVRGLIAADHLAGRLKVPLDLAPPPESFCDVVTAIRGHRQS